MRLSLAPPHHTFQPSSAASDHQRGGSESSRSVAETDDYFFELRGQAQLRLGAERGRFFSVSWTTAGGSVAHHAVSCWRIRCARVRLHFCRDRSPCQCVCSAIKHSISLAAQRGHFDVWLVLLRGPCIERGPFTCERLETAYVRACRTCAVSMYRLVAWYCTDVIDASNHCL